MEDDEDFSNFMDLLQPKISEEDLAELDRTLHHKTSYEKLKRLVGAPIIVLVNRPPYIKLGFGIRTFAHPKNEHPCLEFEDYSEEGTISIEYVRFFNNNVLRFNSYLLTGYCRLTEIEFSFINFPYQGKERDNHSRLKLVGIAEQLKYRNGFYYRVAKYMARKRHKPD